MKNTLYYGDNLDILREYLLDESVDLVYLDPPFNSNRSYNVLFKDESGAHSEAQIEAFEDTWHWSEAAEETYRDLVTDSAEEVSRAISALRELIGTNQVMAYLVMMSARLVELHRALKPTGSIFLHCDPTASHYLKVVMDAIFGPQMFVNEVIWKRADTVKGNAGQGSRAFGPNTDTLLFYRKTSANIFNAQFTDYSEEYIRDFYKYVEPETGRQYRLISMTGPGGAAKGNPSYEVMGVTRYWRYSEERMQQLIDEGMVVQTKPGGVPQRKQYLDEGKGVPVQSLWDDIPALHSQSGERLSYPTQKPLALLERVISTSSNPGDVVLDPFCGCGTAVAAAHKLGRRWIGIDVTHLSVALMKYRLEDMFPDIDIEVIGEPEDLASARQLAADNPYQFQWWALSLVRAKPLGENKSGGKTGKKGADRGVDGTLNFLDDRGKKRKTVVVQVKGGKNVGVGDIRDLVGTIDRPNSDAVIGVYISLHKPTKPMVNEALEAGWYSSPDWGKDYRKIQLLTIEELLQGKEISMPPQHGTFRQARRAQMPGAEQSQLDL